MGGSLVDQIVEEPGGIWNIGKPGGRLVEKGICHKKAEEHHNKESCALQETALRFLFRKHLSKTFRTEHPSLVLGDALAAEFPVTLGTTSNGFPFGMIETTSVLK